MRWLAFSHRSRPIAIGLFLVALLISPAWSAPEVARAPAPAWVTEIPLPATAGGDPGTAGGGVAYLLMDRQRNEAEQTTYEHVARKFTSASGVQDSARVAIDFAPGYQKLTLHQLVLHRDGVAIDRLPSANVRVLEREPGMESDVYDGFVTASVDVEDVRVGDTLEYAYSITGDNPVFNGVFSDFVFASWPAPVARFQYRLLWPKDRFLATKVSGPGPKPAFTKTELGDLVEYRWFDQDVAAVNNDGDTPVWYSPYTRIQLSEYRDWSDVVDWALDFYSVGALLPPAIQSEVERLSRLSDPELQIVGALEYVQNNLRYLSNAEGVHSHRPYPIEEVVARGYGDCKDKARLLTAMLRALGFTASPALVHSSYRQEIGDWLPSPLDFDHVIVALTLDHRVYWLDPTRDHQGGKLAERYGPAYGKALLIQPNEIGLTNVALSGKDQAGVVRDTSLLISAYHAPVAMTIHTTYTGSDADLERSLLAEISPSDVAKNRLNLVAGEYRDVVRQSEPTFHEQVADNRFVSDDSYLIRKFWQPRAETPGRLYGEVYPSLIKGYLQPPGTQIRTAPLGLDYPKKVQENFVFSLPERGDFHDRDFAVDDPAFQYRSSVRVQERTITVSYTYEALADSVAADRMPEYLENLHQAQDNLGYSVTVPTNQVEGGPAPVPAGALNWPVLVLMFFFVLVGLACAVAFYLWRPQWPPRPAHPRYAGLSGWLILVGFGLFARPITTAFSMRHTFSFLNVTVWNNLTLPGQSHYDPCWAPLLLGEMFLSTTFVIFSLLLLVLFFQRRRTFPVLFIWMIAVAFFYAVADSLAVSLLAGKFPELHLDTSAKQVTQTMVQIFTWIPYMLISQRVRATFVK